MKPLALVSALALSLAFVCPRAAYACGAVFVEGEVDGSAPVAASGHRMILSLSPETTTLWDEVTLTGDASSFAWILPVHGDVDVALSSDELFRTIDSMSAVTVTAFETCSCFCGGDSSEFSTAFAGTGAGGEAVGDAPAVTVSKHEVVGPYDVVQISAQDPNALETWLAQNGYSIPADVQPTVDAYALQGFDFVAMKLVPGAGADAMRPVRVTMPGAGVALPLRMVAAGTGALVPVTLWVVAEGRYLPAPPFDWLYMPDDEITFDWDSMASDYVDVRSAALAAAGGAAFVTEASGDLGITTFDGLLAKAKSDPSATGYGDSADVAVAACQADLDALFSHVPSPQYSRLYAELPRASLTSDLTLVPTQHAPVSPEHPAGLETGSPRCTCDPCPPSGNPSPGGFGGASGDDATEASLQAGGGCADSPYDRTGWGGAVAIGIAAMIVCGRRSRSSFRSS